MSFAFLDRLLTPCPWPVRAMGFLKEAIGIQYRYRRCQSHWRHHIERCRSIILRSIENCEQRRQAVILGAGLLHDVPLRELSAAFQQVMLVDLVHPLSQRYRTRGWRNVNRLRADVTNTVADLYRVSDEPDLPLPESKPDLFANDRDVDLVVSLNLLSQLPCMPLAYLERWRAHSTEKMNSYARGLIRAHLDYLARLPGRVVLISDVERIKVDLRDNVVERKDLLFGLKLPQAGEDWEWRLAPCPEADPKHHFYRKVVGFEIAKSI